MILKSFLHPKSVCVLIFVCLANLCFSQASEDFFTTSSLLIYAASSLLLSTFVSSNFKITSPGFKSIFASSISTTSTPVASNFIPHASPPKTNCRSPTLSLNSTLFATVSGVVRYERVGKDKKQVSVYEA